MDEKAEVAADLTTAGIQGYGVAFKQPCQISLCWEPWGQPPWSHSTLPSVRWQSDRLDSVGFRPLSALTCHNENWFIDYSGPEKLKEVKRNPEFFSGSSSSRSRAEWAVWSPPSRRKSLSLDLFPVYLLIFAGQDHGQLLANRALSSLSFASFSTHDIPPPVPQQSFSYHSLQRIQIFPARVPI